MTEALSGIQPVVPALGFPAELLLRAQDVRAAIFDVDGVLTDGRIYIGEQGETVKAFSTLDGHGLKLLAQAGITPLVITGRDSPAVRRRCADLGLAHGLFGIHDKLQAAQQLLATLHLATGDLNRVQRIAKLTCFVRSTPAFAEQHVVANGASTLLAEVFGPAGVHSRSAVGVAALPLGACVEIDLVAEIT